MPRLQWRLARLVKATTKSIHALRTFASSCTILRLRQFTVVHVVAVVVVVNGADAGAGAGAGAGSAQVAWRWAGGRVLFRPDTGSDLL